MQHFGPPVPGPLPPSEFELPLQGIADWAGPEGIGDTRFDDVEAPEAPEFGPGMGDDPRLALRRCAACSPPA